LKGKGLNLKRSAALEGKHPQYIHLLETLNIFAVRANYMARFREYLEREGVEVELPYEIILPVLVNKAFLKRGLVVPRLPNGRDFTCEANLLKPDPNVSVQVDLSTRIQIVKSTCQGLRVTDVRAGQPQKIPAESLKWIDWQQVYLDLVAYKERKGWNNLVIRPEVLPQIIEQVPCTVVAEETVLRPKSFADRERLQQAVTELLCRYAQKKHEEWEARIMEYQELTLEDPNINFNKTYKRQLSSYILRISRSESKLIQDIESLSRKLFTLYRRETSELPRLHFDRHIYLPLLIEKSGIRTSPPSLNPSEKKFVSDLRAYYQSEKNRSLRGKEIFLLRNLSRGRGIGFFEGRGFYPDFILWILDTQTNAQRIIFIEPHGMLHARAYIHDEKARLWERLPALAEEIEKRSKHSGISLDAFIISATSYDDLRLRYDSWDHRDEFTRRHILFQERGSEYDYIRILLGG
ncbi:MAG: hypothetical protein N2260_00575, partial [Syntrophobacterales bacterium]|nr:hypothetical protein [Syntrophobacterales bacterium]